MPPPIRMSVRQIAAEAGMSTRDALEALRAAGFAVGTPKQRLEGAELKRARTQLGLFARRRPPTEPARRLTRDELIIQVLRPLLAKGKVGRTHTTPIENTWGHGVPPHQKDEARALVESMLKDGALEEKVSQSRRHVWVTTDGRALLDEAIARQEAAEG